MAERIYLSAPDVGVEEEEAALRAIRSGWVAPLGPELDAFEREVADRVGVQHAVGLSSATAALHLGLLGLGVQPGDIVITSTFTFVATANAIIHAGAQPFFIDSDPVTGNMSPSLLRSGIERLRHEGMRIGAILPVDLLGKTADYTSIGEIAEEFDIPVLCDSAESFGSRHRNTAAGSWGDAAVLSFNGNKIMTTSGGGMLLTDSATLADQARFLSTQARDAAAHYEHSVSGFNYRLSNVLAAIGRAQLSRLDEMIERRRLLRARYRTFFANLDGVEIFGGDDDELDNCWLTAILVDSSRTGWKPGDLSAELESVNIESRPLWKPMHLQPLFAGTDGEIDGTAQRFFETGLTLPSGSSLKPAEIDRVFAALEAFLMRHS